MARNDLAGAQQMARSCALACPDDAGSGRRPGDRPARPALRFRMAFLLSVAAASCASSPAVAQRDPGIRGGLENTAGMLEYHGLPIPHPPVISPNPTSRARISQNELKLFEQGILRAG